MDELCDATIELIRKNNLPSCYIRPIVYRGYGVMGVDPTGAPTDVAIAVWPWDTYLGDGALDNGVAVGVSSWRQRSRTRCFVLNSKTSISCSQPFRAR